MLKRCTQKSGINSYLTLATKIISFLYLLNYCITKHNRHYKNATKNIITWHNTAKWFHSASNSISKIYNTRIPAEKNNTTNVIRIKKMNNAHPLTVKKLTSLKTRECDNSFILLDWLYHETSLSCWSELVAGCSCLKHQQIWLLCYTNMHCNIDQSMNTVHQSSTWKSVSSPSLPFQQIHRTKWKRTIDCWSRLSLLPMAAAHLMWPLLNASSYGVCWL